MQQHSIEIRLQVAALVLAEERSFSRAAERLHLTQPALSKRIAELESKLGFKLFTRGQKQVEITESGQVFIRGIRDAHALLEGAIRRARTTGEGIQPVIAIGHSPYADPALVEALFGIQLPLYPNLRLRMESMFANDLTYALLASELDLALIAEPTETPQLTQVQIAVRPLCVAMPAQHPAAAKPTVELRDFRSNEWIVFSRIVHPKIYDHLMNEAHALDVSPVVLHHYITPSESLQLVSASFGVAIAPEGMTHQLRGPDIAIRPLSERRLQIASYLVLPAERSSRLVNVFGRAFLKRVLPQDGVRPASNQLLLNL